MANLAPGMSRRGFLRASGIGALGLSLADVKTSASSAGGQPAVILLMLVGGPSQLESWDPKPDAPSEVRGPFGTIATSVPGVRFNEHLPRLARRMDRLTLVRSLHHDSAPIHETGHQLIQTGRLCRLGQEHPHFGAVAASLRGQTNGAPPFVVLPSPIGNTGVSLPHGQSAGPLGAEFEPFRVSADPGSAEFDPRHIVDVSPCARAAFNLADEPAALRDAYGRNTFGQSCLLARRLVERGTQVVTVNMFETVFNRVTWDCHGARPFSTLDDYANVLLPTLDAAFSALIDDLDRRGLLETTLVLATGEFGRTPRINAAGGRDHWPGVWTAALAGGGTRGGQVIGASDANAAEPADRPVTPPELLATVYRSLRIDPAHRLTLADGSSTTLIDEAQPIAEAFA